MSGDLRRSKSIIIRSYVPEVLYDLLVAGAAKEGISQSAYMCKMLERGLALDKEYHELLRILRVAGEQVAQTAKSV